jgi:hypothetical protein
MADLVPKPQGMDTEKRAGKEARKEEGMVFFYIEELALLTGVSGTNY